MVNVCSFVLLGEDGLELIGDAVARRVEQRIADLHFGHCSEGEDGAEKVGSEETEICLVAPGRRLPAAEAKVREGKQRDFFEVRRR